ncbi:hypothetical protein SARC_06226 [Sphaeroforma arctica JP610]|uniref:Uncharacterized protein n=1 Tax=Sphaeroforma arctica JP610 TaxID=667725 RepID=A0A0L0FX95_9EUKA|nr:hypothetical protein SARC_06226 [Sphaeroforma arctica JP610]KNC81457.1 hypothetical protein SARC_06226 [Sphaeroforma arctica JP610]|eukprot:XP_014155359.1 hypothetical protein SARC_06226 [Sphaeroforma arctica JP610]
MWYTLWLASLPVLLNANGIYNIHDAFEYGNALTRDFGNDIEALDAPEDLIDLAGRLLETAHLPDGLVSPLSEPSHGKCNGVNVWAELNSQGSYNYSVDFNNITKRQKQKDKARHLPNPDEVFERLFRRKGPMINETEMGLNFLWVSWVNFYFEDTLRTKPNSQGAQQMDADSQRSNLAMVYGRSKEREHVLRSFSNGRLKTSRNNHGEEMALVWSDVNDTMAQSAANLTEWQLYVLGDNGLNSHWGHLFWVSLYTREHNRVCDQLLLGAIDEGRDLNELTDERLFRMARVIMTTRHARAFLENFASDIGLRANGINTRVPFSTLSCDVQSRKTRLHKPPDFSIEYLHAYTFHQSIPDYVHYDTAAVSVAHDMFRRPPAFANYTMQQHVDAFYRSPAGRIQGDNIPGYLGFVFKQQLLDARANGLASYKAYVEHYSSHKHTVRTFADLMLSASLTQAISEVYDSVDDIDAYVGIQLEGMLVPTTSMAVSITRVALILGKVIPNFVGVSCYDDPHLYSAEFLTRKGMQFINGPSEALWDLMQHHVQLEDNTPFVRTHEWRHSRGVGANAAKGIHDYSVSNLGDYAGLNAVWSYALQSTREYLWVVIAIVGCMVMYVVAYAIASWALHRHCFVPRNVLAGDMPLLTHYAVLGVALTLQIPVYTYVFATILFSDRLDRVMWSLWPLTFALVSSHAVLYVADMAVRKPAEMKVFLVVHHLCWYATYMLPLVTQDIFTLRVGMVADYFTVYEGGLYLLMFYSKLQHRHLSDAQACLGRAAVCVFAFTRVVQMVLLISMYVMAYTRMVKYGHTGVYVISVIKMSVVMLSQVYVLYLYSQWPSLWKRDHHKTSGAANAMKDSAQDKSNCTSIHNMDTVRAAGLLSSVSMATTEQAMAHNKLSDIHSQAHGHE